MSEEKLKITLIKSKIGALPKQKKTLEALGLKKLNRYVFQKDNPAIWGMIKKVSHMVKVEKVENAA